MTILVTTALEDLDYTNQDLLFLGEWCKKARQALELRQTSGKRAFTGFKQAVVVEHVSFAYPGHPPCIQEINMMIPKGKMVAIVGKSGAGKSTLIDIIMMFSEPLDGQIYVDGVPLHEFDIIPTGTYRICSARQYPVQYVHR